MEKQPEILGLKEAAEILGWKKQQVITYMKRGVFPEPYQRLAAGPLWLRKTIEEYKASRS